MQISFYYNLRQGIIDKFTKESKKDFSMESFTSDFLPFFTKKCQNLGFCMIGWVLATKSMHLSHLIKIS